MTNQRSQFQASSCLLLWLLGALLNQHLASTSGEPQAAWNNREPQPIAAAANQRQTNQASGQFCQSQTVGQRLQATTTTSAAAGGEQVKKVFCFYDIQDDFRPQDLNPCLCTHVVYSYVAVRKNLSFIAGKKGDLRSLASLKRKNPNLKLLVSLRPDDYFAFDASQLIVSAGQDNATAGAPATRTAPAPSSEPTASGGASKQPLLPIQMNEMHQKFAKRIRDFIVRHSLDGINLDWPYFAQVMPSANASRDHLNLVLEALNENFQTSLAQSSPSSAYLRRLQAPLVTLTISKDFYSIVDGYDFARLQKLLDFVHLPAFDFDLNVDQYSIGHPARLHGISDAENLDTLVDLLLSSGLPSEQLIAGLPSHGVQITSRPQAAHILPAGSSGQQNVSSGANLDEQLEAAANISIISHSEVCRIRDLVRSNCSLVGQQQAQCWTMSRARDLTAPFAYDSEHWVGFDDETSIKLKAKYVLLRHLAGVAMFTVNQDDPIGACGFGPYPLLATINGVFARAASAVQQQQQQPDKTIPAAESSQRGYFTRAPNQLMTATSLISQMFGRKVAQPATTATPNQNNGDLMSSASDQSEVAAASQQQQQQGSSSLMSFVDIIEKYGAVSRLDSGDSSDPDRQLPCDRIGYQRYPRDCSRFYRCVQTPPVVREQPADALANATATTTTTTRQPAQQTVSRLQYECPSGLVFDEQYQICNWPSWSAQCTGSGEVNSITNAKFVCPNYGYFQNQENCEYFYYCSDYNRAQSQAYQFRCPFELGFDEEKLQCNWKWLVKGCNVTSQQQSAGGGGGVHSEQQQQLAQKYLKSLEAGPNESSADSKITTTTTTTSTTTAAATTTTAPEADLGEIRRLKRDAPEEQRASTAAASDQMESRSFTSHVTSLLASLDAIREYRMKKSGSARPSSTGAQAADSTRKYPSFVGAPQQALGEPSSGSAGSSSVSFRVRRRQATAAPKLAADSARPQQPYKQRPPPPSVFPFLPASAIYMLTDSLRSYGEAIQGELNRYMRVAGDQVRRWFGPNLMGAPAAADTSRRADEHQAPASAHKQRRAKRDAGGAEEPTPGDDLEALESRPAELASYARPPRQLSQPPPQLQYRDPLNRPPGYPLNHLDNAARAAVLGPEPKLYSQPRALASAQMTPISQQEYERLLGATNAGPMRSQHGNQQQRLLMASAASSQQVQVMPAPANMLAEHRDRGHEQPAEIPFGMPSLIRPIQQQQQQSEQAGGHEQQQPPSKRVRLPASVALRLANLAMPKFAQTQPPQARPASTEKSTTNEQRKAPASHYRSFLPAFVAAPARSLMNKAMDINKAVQNLISTLAPGNSRPAAQTAEQPEQPAATTTTMMMMTTPPMPPRPTQSALPLQHQMRPQQPPPSGRPMVEQQQQPPKLNRTSLPLMLTEQEARALSAQLDQLSKEQLELLSSELFAQESGQPAENQQIRQQQPQPQNANDDDKQDYVMRLLKVLSQQSHNPEDVRLLDQLAGQLNNPRPGQGGDSSLIELGQSDDAALLEAIGLVPKQQQQQPQSQSGEKKAPEELQPASSYEHYMQAAANMLQPPQHPLNEIASQHAGSLHGAKQARPDNHPAWIEQNGVNFVNVGQLNGAGPNSDGSSLLVPIRSDPQTTAPQHYGEYNYYNTYPPTTTTTTTTTTSTTTTTPRPQIITTEFVEERFVERPAPPVQQTFTELVESNVTTPDGIETSLETRTKTAISSGAAFNVGAPIGLGLVPGPFAGSLESSGGAGRHETLSPAELARLGRTNSRGAVKGSDLGQVAGSVQALTPGAGYNFAGQPVSQMEEVIIKKRFKPFPKQLVQPQTTQEFSSFQQEIRNEPGPQPTISVGGSQQEQVSFVDSSTLKSFANDEPVSSTTSSSLEQQLQRIQEQRTQFQQFKEEDEATTAASFGESSAQASAGGRPNSSLTKQELRLSQAEQKQQADAVGQLQAFALSEGRQQLGGLESAPKDNSEPAKPKTKPRGKSRKRSKQVASSTPAPTALADTSSTVPPEESALKEDARGDELVGANSTAKPVERSENNSSALKSRRRNNNSVEAAFSNLMVEIKRSRAPASDSQRLPMPSTTQAPPTTTIGAADDTRSRKSRSKQGETLTAAGDSFESSRGSSSSSSSDRGRPEQPKKKNKKTTGKKSKRNRQQTQDLAASSSDLTLMSDSSPILMSSSLRGRSLRPSSSRRESRGEKVAIYGTKSGFMPIITPDDPSYSTSDLLAASSAAKHQAAFSELRDDRSSWRNFVRRLEDQISVVDLGNFSERQGAAGVDLPSRSAKLIILPASPNNNLLEAGNWKHLAAYYPQLFPSNRTQIEVGPIELGPASIAPGTGLIEERSERARFGEWADKFPQLSGLIEPQTFKALDEIVQRSSGQMFMMRRLDDGARTVIAVIPDRPLIRQRHPPTAANYQRQVQVQVQSAFEQQQGARLRQRVKLALPKSEPTISSLPAQTAPARDEAGEQQLQQQHKAATFSRAIQESIQNAIRQHYQSMKEQLRESMISTTTSTTRSPTTERYTERQERPWSTPPSESLAHLESASGPLDPLDASSSSTEYSIVGLDGAATTPASADLNRRQHVQYSIYEVDGAEPKSLYGLELLAQPAKKLAPSATATATEQTSTYLTNETSDSPIRQSEQTNNQTTTTTPATTTTTTTTATAVTASTRFISIGSHLIASPKRPPKVVDQAYVSHFYDHIGNDPSAKAANLDELLVPEQQQVSRAEETDKEQQASSSSTSLSEDSLVPESACTRAGLFQHPFACNKFYECFWDKQLNKFTLHMFECPIKLAFDDRIVGCAMPIESSLCVNY